MVSKNISRYIETIGFDRSKKTPESMLEFYGKFLTTMFKPIRHGGYIVLTIDSFACCGSIRDLEKVKFSENPKI